MNGVKAREGEGICRGGKGRGDTGFGWKGGFFFWPFDALRMILCVFLGLETI
jgi:hypothetical protein